MTTLSVAFMTRELVAMVSQDVAMNVRRFSSLYFLMFVYSGTEMTTVALKLIII
jgi:hypothetical protein